MNISATLTSKVPPTYGRPLDRGTRKVLLQFGHGLSIIPTNLALTSLYIEHF